MKAGVVVMSHKDIVLNGYGWTRQRFSAEGILGRERLQLVATHADIPLAMS